MRCKDNREFHPGIHRMLRNRVVGFSETRPRWSRFISSIMVEVPTRHATMAFSRRIWFAVSMARAHGGATDSVATSVVDEIAPVFKKDGPCFALSNTHRIDIHCISATNVKNFNRCVFTQFGLHGVPHEQFHIGNLFSDEINNKP